CTYHLRRDYGLDPW
nr:immunoglobulin heavy chain junction region [Macaca mulatta]